MSKLTITVKEAADMSQLPASFIRMQVINGAIPHSYCIKHKYRKSFIIYRRPFLNWLEELKGSKDE